jgi:hypothetical protein
MVRLDGNGVMLSAYNRNATISNNDVSWNGDTVGDVTGDHCEVRPWCPLRYKPQH